MHVVAFIFFSAALMLSLVVVGHMLFAYRHRILEALAGHEVEAEAAPTGEVVYLQSRRAVEIEWRKAA